tara:strand:- start:276 stop:1037 length:762 start_codon:yes stop_codon:yes gene_type:complete
MFSMTTAYSRNTTFSNFTTAKRHMTAIYAKLDKKHHFTLYCKCSFSKKVVDHRSCGYIPKRAKTKKGGRNKRAYRLEWEHIVPAHAFGQSFDAWKNKENYKNCKQKSSRSCARQEEPEFRYMEADLYNLFPAIGEVNADRSNFSMAMISGERRDYGSCDVEINNRKIEPNETIRGDIARTYMYMNAAYPHRGIISNKNAELFEVWHRQDPVDRLEIERAKAIQEKQGNCNAFVLDCSNNKPISVSTGFPQPSP